MFREFWIKNFGSILFLALFRQDKRTTGASRLFSKAGEAILRKKRSRDAVRVSARNARTDARSSHVTFQNFKGLSCVTD